MEVISNRSPLPRSCFIRWTFVLASCVALSQTTCWAQIVNTEPLFRHIDDQPYSFLAEASVDRQSGNTNALKLGASVAGRYRILDHEFLLTASHQRESALDQQIANKSFAHARYRYYFTERIQGEFYGQIAQDLFRQIALRKLMGIGPRFIPLDLAPLRWSLAVSTMYEVEQLEENPDFPPGYVRKRHRFNLASIARVDVEPLLMQQSFYIQPAYADVSNVRVLHSLELAWSIQDYLSVKWSLEQALDTIALTGVRPLDNRVRMALKFDL